MALPTVGSTAPPVRSAASTATESARRAGRSRATVRPALACSALQLRVVRNRLQATIDGGELGRQALRRRHQRSWDPAPRPWPWCRWRGTSGSSGRVRARRPAASSRGTSRRHGGRRGARRRGRARKTPRTKTMRSPRVAGRAELEAAHPTWLPRSTLTWRTSILSTADVRTCLTWRRGVRCRSVAPGRSCATTIPMATVAPVAAMTAPRVRTAAGLWPCLVSAGVLGLLGGDMRLLFLGWWAPRRPLSHHAVSTLTQDPLWSSCDIGPDRPAAVTPRYDRPRPPRVTWQGEAMAQVNTVRGPVDGT